MVLHTVSELFVFSIHSLDVVRLLFFFSTILLLFPSFCCLSLSPLLSSSFSCRYVFLLPWYCLSVISNYCKWRIVPPMPYIACSYLNIHVKSKSDISYSNLRYRLSFPRFRKRKTRFPVRDRHEWECSKFPEEKPDEIGDFNDQNAVTAVATTRTRPSVE